MQKLGQLLAEFVQTFRPAAKMVSIAGLFLQFNIQQIMTFVEVTIGNCFPEFGETLPDAEGRSAEGNISPTEGKQFSIVTDNNCHYVLLYLIAIRKNTNTHQSKQPTS